MQKSHHFWFHGKRRINIRMFSCSSLKLSMPVCMCVLHRNMLLIGLLMDPNAK